MNNNKYKILLVEDEEKLARFVELELVHEGYTVEKSGNGRQALDMALQRGGNQVALQRRGATGLVYFGGAHKTLESNTSITSRVSASLLERHLSHSDNVLIMGHKDPDFDAIGSAVGDALTICSIGLAILRPVKERKLILRHTQLIHQHASESLPRHKHIHINQ